MDFKFYNNNSAIPWPVITFNQQNETPEMFYKTSSSVSNPSYSEDPIGVFFEYEGNAMISGKKVAYKKVTASDKTTTRNGWRKAEITVTPGKVNVKVYDSDYAGGNVIVDYTTELSEDYKGGYIALMQNGVNLFKAISITSSTEETQINLTSSKIVCGSSSKSFSLSFGIITVFIPDLCALIDFSFNPPIANTLPLKVTSPVIATSDLTVLLVNTETIAVVNVIPAEGPSFGTAPSGT